jgi:hypothetical protein
MPTGPRRALANGSSPVPQVVELTPDEAHWDWLPANVSVTALTFFKGDPHAAYAGVRRYDANVGFVRRSRAIFCRPFPSPVTCNDSQLVHYTAVWQAAGGAGGGQPVAVRAPREGAGRAARKLRQALGAQSAGLHVAGRPDGQRHPRARSGAPRGERPAQRVIAPRLGCKKIQMTC